MSNVDLRTVTGFGEEWTQFDQTGLTGEERESIFRDYFSLWPDSVLSGDSVGADIGCGSGRWAVEVAPKVKRLWALDASPRALQVAKRNLENFSNVSVVQGDAGHLPIPENCLDFAYSLGVLHHVPDTKAALIEIAGKLRDHAPVLLYLYYNFENRPPLFRFAWWLTDCLRRGISRLPHQVKFLACDLLALAIYWPLARASSLAESIFSRTFAHWPLRYYQDKSFYVMRTDALDRFGTSLEKRFSRRQITELMEGSGFYDVAFSSAQPYWTLSAKRRPRA